MKKRFILKSCLYPFVCIFLTFLGSCSGNKNNNPEKKVNMSLRASGSQDLYDVLEDYKGLENFFTYGELETAEFENRLFGDFLGNDATADIIVSMIDIFPILINTGATIDSLIFTTEVQAEMESKGPIPDFISTMGVISECIIDLDEEKKAPFYNYLEELENLRQISTSEKGLIHYYFDIITDINSYLATLDEKEINQFMHFVIKDFMEFRVSKEGVLDFTDVDDLIKKFSSNSPDGLIEIFEGLRLLFYDQEFKDVYTEGLSRLGNFLGDEKVFAELKALFINLYNTYEATSLGDLIERMWDEGPIVGPAMEEMDIEGFGRNGRMSWAAQEMLMHPTIINKGFEVFYNFRKEGYEFDRIDDQIIKMVHSNPFCNDRKGEGEFGNGNFYEPNEHLSYKNFSSFKGFVALLARWNVPFTLTCPFIHETEQSDAVKNFFREMVPEADSLPAANFIWAEMYEKDPDQYIGSGHPITEKRGYGMMVNGVYVAPVCPAILNAGNVPLYMFGDSVYNGPYDNIYDNLKWLFYERNIYATIDLVQLSPYVPMLKNLLTPFFNLFGIKQLPITLVKMKGTLGILNLEISTVVENLPAAISNELIKINVPRWMVTSVVELAKQILPMGTHVENSSIVYLMPQDIRDMATMVYATAYFDPEAFHIDRFLDLKNPSNYTYFYDIRDYSYEKNYDTANQFWNFGAPLSVAAYLCYRDAIGDTPLSMDYVAERQKKAKEALGVIYPISYINNTTSPLTEIPTENSIYNVKDSEIMPVFEYLEPLTGMESFGVMDQIFELMAVMGKPELMVAREKLMGGIAKIVGTIDKNTQSTYTLASELLKITQKAQEDERRWDSLHLLAKGFHNLLSADSPHQIVEELVGLVDYLTGVEISDENFRLASEGIVDVLKKTCEQRVLTRGLFHATTILDEIDKIHIWGDTVSMLDEALKENGVFTYLVDGFEKDPEIPWSDVFEDTDRFLHSELMKKYEEGSFWKDVYYFLDFMAEAID